MSLSDSLNDSLQNLQNISRSASPDSVIKCEQSASYNSQFNTRAVTNLLMSSPQQVLMSGSSNKLTYSTDKHSPEGRYITFGQNSYNNLAQTNKLISAESLIQSENFDQALRLLQSTEEHILKERSISQKIFLNYLYAVSFYALEKWDEFYYSANEVVQLVFQGDDVDIDQQTNMLLHCLQMLVTAELKAEDFQNALTHQAMLVELAHGQGEGNVEQLIILGDINQKLQRFNDAYVIFYRASYMQATEEQKRIILMSLFNISQTLGKDDECVKFGKESLQFSSNLQSIQICQTLANIHHKKQEEAQTHFWLEELLRFQIDEYGYTNINTVQTIMNLAQSHLNLSQFQKSFELFKKASAALAQLYGQQNIQYAYCCMSLGLTSFYLKNYQESNQYYAEADQLYEKLFGQQDEKHLRVRFNLIQVMIKLRQSDNIEKLYQQFIVQLRSADQMLAVKFANELGNIFQKSTLYSVAIDSYMFALQLLNSDNSQNGLVEKCLLLQNMGATYHLLDEFQRSIGCYKEAQKISLQLGEKKLAAQIEKKVGQYFEGAGRIKEAQAHFRNSKKLMK